MSTTNSPHRGLTRRNFLKTTGAVAGVTAIAGSASPLTALAENYSAGQIETQGEQIFRGVCRPNCFGFCHMNVHVRDGRVVKTSRAPYHHDPHYTRICQRGLSHVQRIYDPDRLKYPLRRVEGTERGAGQWERVSWDEAISDIASHVKSLQEEHGSQAVAVYKISGNYGQLAGAMYGRLFSHLQVCNISADMDMATYYGGWRINGGINECNEISDVLNARTIMVYGANITDAQVHHWHFIKEAQQNGTKLVVVDPIFTQLAAKADIWIPIRPGSDTVLYMGLMGIILEKKAVDVSFMTKSTVAPFLVRSDTGKFLRQNDIRAGAEADAGKELDDNLAMNPYMVFENGELVAYDKAVNPDLDAECRLNGLSCSTAYSLLLDEVAKFPPDIASKMTDIPVEKLYELADICIDGPVSHLLGYGSAAYSNGVQVITAGITMSALTGNMCKSGASFGNSYPVYTGTNYAFSSPVKKMTPGVHALDLGTIMKTGKHLGKNFPVKMLYVYCGNPLNSACSTNVYLNDIWPSLDYVVVADSQMTDTARYADLVLPTAQHFEHIDFCSDGPTWNLHYNEKAIDSPYEAKSDADIVRLLADKLGYGEHFLMTDEEALKVVMETDAGREAGLTWDALKEYGDLRYDEVDPHISWVGGVGFTTPTGRLEFYAEDPKVIAATSLELDEERAKEERLPHWFPPFEAWYENEVMKKYPLQLMSERARYRVHSQYFNVAMLRELDPEPFVKINPKDAEARGIADNSYVECYNDRGHAVAKAVYSEAMRPGVMVYPKGWQISQHKAGMWSELLTGEFDVFSVNSNFMDVVCEVRPWSNGGEQ